MTQTILVVDDDPVQRRLLETAITQLGLQALTAPGGRPALELINSPRGAHIALMLLDLAMPDMDGLEVLGRLRHPDLPVIVLTTKDGIDQASEAMRAGASDFLVKPASPERIGASIRNQIRIGALSGEVRQLKKMPPADIARGIALAARAHQAPPPAAYALNATDASGHVRKFEEMESAIIRMAIARYDGHMSEVARRLGIGRSTLYRKLKEYGLEPANTSMSYAAHDGAIEAGIRGP